MHFDDGLAALVELAACRHNTFSSAEAAQQHVLPHRLRQAELRREIRRLHPRVWAFTSLPDGPGQRLLGSILSLENTYATATSAAWLHGWLAHPPPNPQLWFPRTNGRNHPVADLLRWNRIDPRLDTTTVDRIPTLNKAATLCSLGPHVDSLTLERCLDEFLRTESVRWLDETMTRLGSKKPGGVAALASVRNDPKRVQGISDSWFERVVAKLVALSWLPPIELQHVVALDDRRYRLDIACPDLMLGIEAHSRTFHFGSTKEDADNVRDLDLVAAGWQMVYVTWAQIQNPDVFVRQFAQAARTRAAQLGVAISAA